MIGVIIALMVLNGLVGLVTWVWVVVLAGKEGALQAVLCIFVPFYIFYFIISHWEDMQPAGPIYMGSWVLHVLLFVGMFAFGASAVNDAVATANAQNAAAQSAAPTPQPEPSPAPEAQTPEPTPEQTPEPTPENPPAAATPEPTPENPPPTATTNAETPPAEGTTQEPAKPDPNVPETKPEPKFPEGLQGQAQRAFHEGRTQDGNNYLRAALLTSDDKSLWDNVRWCPALERPVIGLRWGVALQLAEQPPVITPPQGGPQGGDGAGPRPQAQAVQIEANPPAGQEGAPAEDELAELRKFTGDFGPKMLERLPKSTLDKLLGPLGEGVNGPKSVQFVGVGADAKAVTSLAQQKGVDEVLVANVSFKVLGVNRNVDATLTLRLIDVLTDKRLWASKSLSSNQAKIEISKGKDPTADVAKSLSDFLDKNFALKDKPDLDIVKLRQRAEVITKDQSNALAALVELRYYQLKGLLTQSQAEIYYRQILDLDSAPLISSGTPEQRRKALERFLPRS